MRFSVVTHSVFPEVKETTSLFYLFAKKEDNLYFMNSHRQ